jgi:hypothetical protein
MLTAGARPGEPFDPEVALLPMQIWRTRILLHAFENGHSDRGRMDAPATLGRRNSLDPMTASLVMKPLDVFS